MYLKKNFNIIIFSLLYSSLLIGFFFGEDLNRGAKPDFYSYIDSAQAFINDFKYTFFNYNERNDRHSPVIIIILSQLIKLGFPEQLIRFFSLNFLLLSVVFFYKCLKLAFKNIDKTKLQLFSLVLLISPTFRALSIWPDSRIFGFFFFLVSLYYFLKFKHKYKKFNYVILNVIFLGVASYLSPNFSVFSIYFFINFLIFYKQKIEIFYYLFLNLFLAFPAFYYLFILDVFFLNSGNTPGSESYIFFSISNFSNKILIILSLLFFYFSPFLISLRNQIFSNNNLGLIKTIIFISLYAVSVIFFDYKIEYTGGGIFFQISNFIFKNNIFFYIICLLAIYIFLIKYSNFNNLLLILVLIFSNPQLTIYHKYFDPLTIILFLTLFDFKIKYYFENLKNTIYMYSLYLLYIVLCIYRINFL